LVSASSLKDDSHKDDCLHFITKMEANKQAFLVFDVKRKIPAEYDRKMRSDALGKRWVQRMILSGRIVISEVAKIEKPIRLKLEAVHFDTDDYHLVVAASGTARKQIVTHTMNCFSTKVIAILKKDLGVDVSLPSSASAEL
jgi:hypothetical protein